MRKRPRFSARAKRVVLPVLITAVLAFLSFVGHACLRGTSAFPGGGRLVDGRYLVEDHGHVYEFTPVQFWSSYIHGIVMIVTMLLYFGVVIRFHRTGDIRYDADD